MTKQKLNKEERNLRQYARDYLFNGVREEFREDIIRHAARIGLPEDIVPELISISDSYLNGLRHHRENLAKAADVVRTTYYDIMGFNTNVLPTRYSGWRPHDFVFATPLNLQQRVLTAFEAEQSRLRAQIEYVQKLVRAADEKRREALAKEYESLADKHNVLALNVGRDPLNLPGDIAIGAYELFTVRNLSLPQDALKRYLESYKFFEDALREMHADEEKPTELYKACRSFLQKLGKHKRDIDAMAAVIGKELDSDRFGKSATNPYKGCIEPFYTTDPTKVRFPSAQADFVAASLIALAKDK